MKIYGQCIDEQGRCGHYHRLEDIVALKCSICQCYYACYHCHNEIETHLFGPIQISKKTLKSILCGSCSMELTYEEYKHTQMCIYCKHPFNPNCAKHQNIYFA